MCHRSRLNYLPEICSNIGSLVLIWVIVDSERGFYSTIALQFYGFLIIQFLLVSLRWKSSQAFLQDYHMIVLVELVDADRWKECTLNINVNICSQQKQAVGKFCKQYSSNPHHASRLILCPLKSWESQRFSYVFGEYRKRPVAWNRFNRTKQRKENRSSEKLHEKFQNFNVTYTKT